MKYVYIFKFDNKYKIGHSVNPEKRLKQLNLGPNAEIIWTHEFPQAHKLERYFHSIYEHKRFSNEWFTLNEEDIDNIIDYDVEDYCQWC